MKPTDITNARVRELASTDGHLLIDGGTVAQKENGTLVIRGVGWNLAIEESAILSSPYGYLQQPSNEDIDKAKAFKLTAPKPKATKKKKKYKTNKSGRKPQAKTTAGRIMEVKKLKAAGERNKAITARTGLSSSSIAKIMRGELDYKLTGVQRAIVFPVSNRKSLNTNRTRRYRSVPETLVIRLESHLRNNPKATQADVMRQFDISSGTYWRVKNGVHTIQLRRK